MTNPRDDQQQKNTNSQASTKLEVSHEYKWWRCRFSAVQPNQQIWISLGKMCCSKQKQSINDSKRRGHSCVKNIFSLICHLLSPRVSA